MDKLEDPEMMLDQARRDMQEAMIANKEKAVQAIAQKNRLQAMMDEQLKKQATLEAQAVTALKQGNRDLAKQLLREKAAIDSSIESLTGTLAGAVQTVESIKVAIKRQEEEVRKKTAEALALKAQWKQSQIQSSITKALEGLTFENEYEGSFASARDRIKDMQAEASARQEMFQGSVSGQVMGMEDKTMDLHAEEELKKLEDRLGMGTASVEAPPVTASASNEDLDAQLDALENKLNQGQ